MFFSTRIVSFLAATSVLLAGSVNGAALIATDPVSACGPPNNSDHSAGSSCKYYAGPSDSSQVLSGTCVDQSGTLSCVV